MTGRTVGTRHAARPTPVTPVVVAGIGSELRGDDGVGPAVVRRIEEHGCPAGVRLCVLTDPLDLVELWDGGPLSVVVDATRSGARPGTVQVIELAVAQPGRGGASRQPATASTHAFGLATVLALARAVGRAPRRVVLVGVEGADFDLGNALTTAVNAAVSVAARRVLELVQTVRRCA